MKLLNLKNVEAIYSSLNNTSLSLPLYASGVSAGFPSPADDYIEKQLDLNEHLISNPSATFFVRVVGESMKDAGIHSGDILVVDRSLEAHSGKIIVAIVEGEFTVKRFEKRKDKVFLVPENKDYSELEIKEHMDFQVWGVVKSVVREF